MSGDEEGSLVSDNSKNAFRDNSESVKYNKRKDASESELIRRRKEGKKQRQEKLIDNLEREKNKTGHSGALETNQSKSKKIKTVFEAQQESQLRTGRCYTVSLALAGSILDNAQSAELRTYLAGQIARALSIFSVDEVIIFDDEHDKIVIKDEQAIDSSVNDSNSQGCLQLARILQYLECPQYLRKHFFPIHRDLQYAGVLNPTDMPHHLRANEVSEYREGVVLESTEKSGSLVNIGLKKNCAVDKNLDAGLRVTVQLDLLNGKDIVFIHPFLHTITKHNSISITGVLINTKSRFFRRQTISKRASCLSKEAKSRARNLLGLYRSFGREIFSCVYKIAV